MSDIMRPISFGTLMTRALAEFRQAGSIFGVEQIYCHEGNKALPIFGEQIETPFGPAAGPHTQLAQNLIAAYAGGSRFFELKTVQTLDGSDLHVAKPCILAAEEGYNVEWSTELTVAQAMDEYIKGWFAIKLLSRELALGSDQGFVFNMSVGYDLNGIRSEKIDRFIEGLKYAGSTDCFKECTQWALQNLVRFEKVNADFVKGISPRICRSITLSTLHGCPPDEIERIATYLIEKKHLNTYVKCNPTLLGYEFARKTMDAMGYDELVFDDHHFKDDLQFEDAVPMFQRLLDKAGKQGVEFGVKLSNTFPVTIAKDELPGEEMYMSGKSLFPLTIALVQKLEKAFDGHLRASYSGGADALNIADIFTCGIWPITLATTLLKPGGYNRLAPIAQALSSLPYRAFEGVQLKPLAALCEHAILDKHHQKPLKPLPNRKLTQPVPLMDCFVSPCQEGCPIHQDITAYLDLVYAGKYAEALSVICEKNPLPFITGTICSHRCQSKCTRHFYEDAVHIRAAKLKAAECGFEGFLPTLHAGAPRQERIAIVGGGPGGLAAAFFAARAGAKVTLFEKRERLGGIVRYVIPAFRIADEQIENDAQLLQRLGVDIRLNAEVCSAQKLFDDGYTHVMLAVGAWEPTPLALQSGNAVDVLDFLQTAKHQAQALKAHRHAVVVGGGNTAMDAARAAKRLPGIQDVTLVYRRTQREMPADLEELELALADGVRLLELRNPLSLQGETLTLDVMTLGQKDASGRASPVSTGQTEALPCDLLIAAIGTRIDGTYLTQNGVKLDTRGRVTALSQSDRLFVLGDALRGPATVVEAIADAQAAVNAALGLTAEIAAGIVQPLAPQTATRGTLCECTAPQQESARCLHCGASCENCVDVCPNRANVAVTVPGMAKKQIIHMDGLCNECGNCAAFCPYDSAPYKDKFTLFECEADFEQSQNQGFFPLPNGHVLLRLNGSISEAALDNASVMQPELALIQAVLDSCLFAK
ncbi:MAG: putative selenate reductase subunit YgfK [Clostridia bacterium]